MSLIDVNHIHMYHLLMSNEGFRLFAVIIMFTVVDFHWDSIYSFAVNVIVEPLLMIHMDLTRY